MGLADYFELDEHGTDVSTELVAGITTFLTMSYTSSSSTRPSSRRRSRSTASVRNERSR